MRVTILRRAFGAALLALGGLLAVPPAEAYPDRPVRLIVPFGTGGYADIVARLIADRVGRDLPNRFVIDNRTGAGGNIGMEAVAHAAPDGYTLGLCGISNCAIDQALYTRMPYDLSAELVPVIYLVSSLNVLVVRNGLPPRTALEFIDMRGASPAGSAMAAPALAPPTTLRRRC